MTIYAGETVRISTTALDYDQETPLTDDDVVSATVAVYDRESVHLFTVDMDYNAARTEWYYDWETGGATPIANGTYFARITLTGASFDTFEIKRVSLRRPRV